MKQLFTAFFLITCLSVHAMELTPQEQECFYWFDTQPLKHEAFKMLTNEETSIYQKQCDESAKQVLIKLITNFFDLLSEQSIQPRFDQETTGNVLWKTKMSMRNKKITAPTNELTARMYVFSTLLTDEQRAAVNKENFLKNPQAAEKAMFQNGTLLAEEMAKLKLIADKPEIKQTFAKNFVTKKMTELQKVYQS